MENDGHFRRDWKGVKDSGGNLRTQKHAKSGITLMGGGSKCTEDKEEPVSLRNPGFPAAGAGHGMNSLNHGSVWAGKKGGRREKWGDCRPEGGWGP